MNQALTAHPAATPTAAPLLSLDGVSFAYDGQPVLADFNLHVRQGETLALLGPSGCGKTTVMNLLAGFLTPTAGEARCAGQLIRGPGPDRGVVFQSYALFDWLSVQDNIAFSLRCAGRSRVEQREVAAQMIDLVGLKGFEQAYPYQLSGGMRQRCSLARVLAAQPRVMLMDEPFAAVDVQTREKLQQEILKIQAATGTTIVFVTHSIEEAVFLGDRVLLLSASKGVAPQAFSIDLPAPRWNPDNRVDDRFLAARNHIYRLMHAPCPEHGQH
jgi:ABC-type nitrate/sulfonate/bicarbonate transport system ATPase subunit